METRVGVDSSSKKIERNSEGRRVFRGEGCPTSPADKFVRLPKNAIFALPFHAGATFRRALD